MFRYFVVLFKPGIQCSIFYIQLERIIFVVEKNQHITTVSHLTFSPQ